MPGDFDHENNLRQLALRTLNLPDDGHYYSFRHDETRAPQTHPSERKEDTRAVCSRSFLTMRKICSIQLTGTANDIYQPSRTAPVLLVVRERYENLGTHISPYLNLGLSSTKSSHCCPTCLRLKDLLHTSACLVLA